MARYPIFCGEEVEEPVKIGKKLGYTYKNGTLTIFRKYNNSWKAARNDEVKPYEAFDVLIKGGRITLIK